MFTGLVADTGTVRTIERSGDGGRLEVESGLAAELGRGDSVAVGGVCLTAVEVSAGRFAVEVIHETLERSSLGRLGRGDRVNLELPLRPADRLGGHIVQGHVDGVGRVESVTPEGFARRVSIGAEAAVCRYLIEKGSVAVDGVSLTVTAVGEREFAVALIPETLDRTTLGELAAGDVVNVEVDLLAKYVERLLSGGVAAETVAAGAAR